MEIKVIRQPKASNLCGQTSVAMIAGIPLEQVIEVYGHSEITYLHEHIQALKKLGFDTGKITKVDNRKKYTLPSLALVRLQKRGRKKGHIIVYCNGVFVDPEEGVFDSKESLLNYCNRNIVSKYKWRIDKYIEVIQNEEIKRIGE